MQIVIDANVIISMLISPGKPIDVFFREEMEVFAPELLLKEIENHKTEICEKSRISSDEIEKLFSILKNKLLVVPEEDFLKYRDEAERICPDQKDVAYFALALCIHCPIWSNEKKLKEQDHVKVYSTHELIEMFR